MPLSNAAHSIFSLSVAVISLPSMVKETVFFMKQALFLLEQPLYFSCLEVNININKSRSGGKARHS